MKIIFNAYKALLLPTLWLTLFYIGCETKLTFLQNRQSGICANHAMGDFVENPEDCALFFWCGENGEAVPASCPSNMLFNTITKLCDTANNVNCSKAPITTAPVPAPSPKPTDESTSSASQFCYNLNSRQPQSNALVFIANPENCYQYYMCYYGQALLQECSMNLYWNAKIGKCDLPSNVNCLPPVDDPNSIQVSPPIDDPSGVDSICPLYGHHIFPHMERCDFFIYCVKGYAILQKCPFYHYFDVESAMCKWRTKALCVKDLKLKFRKTTF